MVRVRENVNVPSVVVAVGGFLDLGIGPVRGSAVRPGLHSRSNFGIAEAGIIHNAAEDAVHNGSRFAARHVVVRSCAAVVALDNAELLEQVDVLFCPVTVDIIEDTASDRGVERIAVEHGDHLEELRTGDRLVGLERAARITGDDAGLRTHLHSVIVPGAAADIREVDSGLGVESGLDLILHQTIQNGGDFGTGDASVRANSAIRITFDVSVVVSGVEDHVDRRVNRDDVDVGLLAEGPVEADEGLILNVGVRVSPGGGHGVSVEVILLGEDGDAVVGDGSGDLILVLVVDHDLSAGSDATV